MALVSGLVGASLAQFNFDRFGPDGVWLDRHIESEWWKLIGVYAAAIAFASAVTLVRAEVAGTAALLGALVGVSIVAGLALDTATVSGGNFWVLGLALVALPALVVGVAAIRLIGRFRHT